MQIIKAIKERFLIVCFSNLMVSSLYASAKQILQLKRFTPKSDEFNYLILGLFSDKRVLHSDLNLKFSFAKH